MGIPTYYVREETTAGPLYFYPIPAVRQDEFDNLPRRELTWFDEEGNRASQRGHYVVTTTQASTLTAFWPERPKLSHYRRKAEAHLSPVARTLVAADPEAYPERLERADWEGRCEYGPDSDCMDCTWHVVRNGIYERVMTEPSTGQQDYDVSGLDQLDLYQPDPDPEREWRLSSPSLAAFYPRPAHHQFPGELPVQLSEVGSAVRRQLEEIGADVERFYEFDSERKISVWVNIHWDETLPWEPVKSRSQKARELNFSRRVASEQLTTWHREARVPRFVTGANKAEALARWSAKLEELVAKLVPPHTVACEKCKGLGYVR